MVFLGSAMTLYNNQAQLGKLMGDQTKYQAQNGYILEQIADLNGKASDGGVVADTSQLQALSNSLVVKISAGDTTIGWLQELIKNGQSQVKEGVKQTGTFLSTNG